MHQQQQSAPLQASSLAHLEALSERITQQTPYLQVMALYALPRPFVKVRDRRYGIVVGFSSDAEYLTYLSLTTDNKDKHTEERRPHA